MKGRTWKRPGKRITRTTRHGVFFLFLLSVGFPAALLPSGEGRARGTHVLIDMGNRAFERGDLESAFRYYSHAETIDPELPHAIYDRGIVLYREGNYHAALAAFRRVAPPDETLAILTAFSQGNCHAHIGQIEESASPSDALDHYWKAIDAYRRALSLDEDFWHAAYNVDVVKERIRKLLARMSEMAGQPGTDDNAQGGDPISGEEQSSGNRSLNVPGDVTGQPDIAEPERGDDTATDILNEESERRSEESQMQGGQSNALRDW